MDESKELNPAANGHGVFEPPTISIEEFDKLSASSVAKNVSSVVSTRQRNPKTSLEQMPFVRLSRRFLPGIGRELSSNRVLTICDALILAYIHTAELAGHPCNATRSYMAVDLGITRPTVSTSLNVLSDAGLVKLDDGCECAIDEESLAKFLGFSGPVEASRAWLAEGEFLRIPLWLLARKKTTPADALVFGDEMSLSLLRKESKPVPAEAKAASLGIKRASLLRSRTALAKMGLLEKVPGGGRKKPVGFFIPDTALDVAQQLEVERLDALSELSKKKTEKAKKSK